MSDTNEGDGGFAAARANVRDTVKWLIAALAGLTAVIVGTSPLTGLASLANPRLAIALASGGAGIALILYAIKLALDLLVTPSFFLGDIGRNKALSDHIDAHAKDLLPPQLPTLKSFLDHRDALIGDLAKETDPGKRKALEDRYAVLQRIAARLMSLSNYERLRLAFETRKSLLFLLTVCGIASFGIFAFAANPPHAPQTGTTLKVTCKAS